MVRVIRGSDEGFEYVKRVSTRRRREYLYDYDKTIKINVEKMLIREGYGIEFRPIAVLKGFVERLKSKLRAGSQDKYPFVRGKDGKLYPVLKIRHVFYVTGEYTESDMDRDTAITLRIPVEMVVVTIPELKDEIRDSIIDLLKEIWKQWAVDNNVGFVWRAVVTVDNEGDLDEILSKY